MPNRQLVALIGFSMLVAVSVTAQEMSAARASDVSRVEIPGLGTVDLNELPPDLQDNIRLPGAVYDEAVEPEYPAPVSQSPVSDPVDVEDSQRSRPESTVLTVEELPWPKSEEERQIREEALREMYPEGERDRPAIQAQPLKDPGDAYLKALEHLQKMQTQDGVPPTPDGDSESRIFNMPTWLTSLLGPWSARRAFAQAAQCSGAPSWTSIGPAPVQTVNGIVGSVPNAGIVKTIAVDPTSAVNGNSQKLFLGTRNGGIWRTTSLAPGVFWSPMPNDSPSLQSEAIMVHPTTPSIILAGTGQGTETYDGGDSTTLRKAVGTLRSIDGGLTWFRIGPSCQGTGCPQNNSDPTTSTLEVKTIAIDSTRLCPGTTTLCPRAWVATSKGLWYSDNALNPAYVCNCTQSPCGTCQVTWTRVAISYDAGGDPDAMAYVFLSPLNNTIMYANVHNSNIPSHISWWRSGNSGGAWTAINSGLPLPNTLDRSAIARGGIAGADTLYTFVQNVASPQCGPNVTNDRLFRTTNSGASWQPIDFGVGSAQACEGQPCNPDCIEGPKLSLEVHPTTPNSVTFGAVQLYRSTNTGCTAVDPAHGCPGTQTVQRIGYGIIHGDENALTFDPNNANILFVGNDGGIWSANFGTSPITWTFLHGNLGNLEFYNGDVAVLNHGHSAGGTQDNTHMRGGTQSTWSATPAVSGDGTKVLIDYTDANISYYTGVISDCHVLKTTDGGLNITARDAGFPPGIVGVHDQTITMDPVDHNTLIVYRLVDSKVYRTITAAEPPGWSSITTSTLPFTRSLGIPRAPTGSPRSDLIFAGTCSGIWRTTNASTGVWNKADQCPSGICQVPQARCITSFAFNPGQSCDATNCTMYVTVSARNGDVPGDVPGHVFRSINSGVNWQDISISNGLPDITANKVVVSPTDSNTIFVGTDMGVYRGTLSGGTWSWCPYMNGFPQVATVKDLTVQAESGILRAFTYGRSAWEVPAFTVPNPEVKVDNDVNNPPATGVYPNSARVSTGTAAGTGQFYAVTWLDDRGNANQWHVYEKAYDSSQSSPIALVGELRVDTTANAHIAGAPSVSAHPSQTTAPYCSRFAWHDDRLNPGINTHIYTQYFCTDGYKTFNNDLRVDQHALTINATNPAIAFKPSLDFAVAWQADRGDGKHDIYARLFGVLGLPQTNQLQMNISTRDALVPAVASDANNNVAVAWEEYDAVSREIWAAIIYSGNGAFLAGPVRVNTTVDTTERHNVQVAFDNLNKLLVTWWEKSATGSLPDTVYMRRFDNGLVPLDTVQQVVNHPPSVPAGANRGRRPTVAVDQNNNFVIAWQATANDGSGFTWNAFARAFNSLGSTTKPDFRIDLMPRVATLRSPALVRTSAFKRFAYVWEDNRAGTSRYDVYTRLGQALP